MISINRHIFFYSPILHMSQIQVVLGYCTESFTLFISVTDAFLLHKCSLQTENRNAKRKLCWPAFSAQAPIFSPLFSIHCFQAKETFFHVGGGETTENLLVPNTWHELVYKCSLRAMAGHTSSIYYIYSQEFFLFFLQIYVSVLLFCEN